MPELMLQEMYLARKPEHYKRYLPLAAAHLLLARRALIRAVGKASHLLHLIAVDTRRDVARRRSSGSCGGTFLIVGQRTGGLVTLRSCATDIRIVPIAHVIGSAAARDRRWNRTAKAQRECAHAQASERTLRVACSTADTRLQRCVRLADLRFARANVSTGATVQRATGYIINTELELCGRHAGRVGHRAADIAICANPKDSNSQHK